MPDLSEIRQASDECRAWVMERPPTREEALILLDCIDTLLGVVAISDVQTALAQGDLEAVDSGMETLAILLDPDTMAALREALSA